VAGHLGLGIANLVNLFNPSVVVLDKRLALASVPILDQIVRIIGRQSFSISSDGVEVKFGALDSKAGVLGIGLGVLDRHYRIPSLSVPRFMIRPRTAPEGYQGISDDALVGDARDVPAHTS
jgi:predicted NBD/HSP70 family sugar kinase